MARPGSRSRNALGRGMGSGEVRRSRGWLLNRGEREKGMCFFFSYGFYMRMGRWGGGRVVLEKCTVCEFRLFGLAFFFFIEEWWVFIQIRYLLYINPRWMENILLLLNYHCGHMPFICLQKLTFVACSVTLSRSDTRVRHGNKCHDLIAGITSQPPPDPRAHAGAESMEPCSAGRRVEPNRFEMEHSGFYAI